MMWEQILNSADRVFSLFTVKGDYCGSIELQQPDSKTPEIGIDLMESKRYFVGCILHLSFLTLG